MPFSAEIFAELIAAQVQAQLKAIYLPNRNMNGKGEHPSQKLEMESRSNLDEFNQKVKVVPPLPQAGLNCTEQNLNVVARVILIDGERPCSRFHPSSSCCTSNKVSRTSPDSPN